MNNYIPINWAICTKWVSYYKHTILLKLNQEELENLNKQITSETEAVTKKLLTKKSPGPMAAQANFTKHSMNY